MKIKLYCLVPQRGRVKVAELDTAKKYLGLLHVDATAEYSAKACLEETEIAEQKMLDCVLHVGHDPDVVAELYDDNFITFKKDKDGDVRLSTKLKLFSQTLGVSRLFFSCENNGHRQEYCLANLWVYNDEKKEFYDKMVEQLVSCEMPQYVVTHFKWQMSCHKFRLGWDDGYATYVDDVTMLRELGALIKDVKGRLNLITLRPYEQIRSEVGYIYASRLKKLDTRGRRSFEKSLRLSNVYEHKIVARKKCVSSDTLAHDVIKTFLLEQKSRLKTIRENLQKEIDEVTVTLNNYATKKDWRRDCKVKIEELKKYQGRAKQLEGNFVQFLEMAILKTSQKRVTIFEVNPSLFMINQAYYGLYQVMLAFARKSFWWDKDRDLPWKRRPKLELDNTNGISQLQFKYSTVYENWCIAHLCLTLGMLGYMLKVNEFDKLKESYSYIFTNGEVEITLWHGIVARPEGDLFRYGNGRRKRVQKTPDFAISISKKEIGSDVWIVGDAKSSEKWNKNTREPYGKYRDIKKKGKDGQWKRPFAIVVLWFGEKEASIQFPQPEPGVEADYKWDKDNGIILTNKDASNYVDRFDGAMSMNVNSENLMASLKELMEGLIKTGLRKLDERDGEGEM